MFALGFTNKMPNQSKTNCYAQTAQIRRIRNRDISKGARLRGRAATQRSEKGPERGSREGVLRRVLRSGPECWFYSKKRVLRRVLRKGSEEGVSRRCLERPLEQCALISKEGCWLSSQFLRLLPICFPSLSLLVFPFFLPWFICSNLH